MADIVAEIYQADKHLMEEDAWKPFRVRIEECTEAGCLMTHIDDYVESVEQGRVVVRHFAEEFNLEVWWNNGRRARLVESECDDLNDAIEASGDDPPFYIPGPETHS